MFAAVKDVYNVGENASLVRSLLVVSIMYEFFDTFYIQ